MKTTAVTTHIIEITQPDETDNRLNVVRLELSGGFNQAISVFAELEIAVVGRPRNGGFMRLIAIVPIPGSPESIQVLLNEIHFIANED